MSEDWLLSTTDPVTTDDVCRALKPADPRLEVRWCADAGCIVVLRATGEVAAWVVPGLAATDQVEAVRVFGCAARLAPAPWKTEVVRPVHARRGCGADARDTGDLATGDIAAAVSAVSGGVATRLSDESPPSPAPPGHGGGVADPCDLRRSSCAVFVQSRPVLGRTPWVVSAMAWSQQQSLTAVFLTTAQTTLTPALRHTVQRGGCMWVRRQEGQLREGRTGLAVIWDGADFVPDVTASLPQSPLSATGDWEVVLQGREHHESGSDLRVGAWAHTLLDACNFAPLTRWGLTEPTSHGWDIDALTFAAAAHSPRPFHYVAGGGEQRSGSYGRTVLGTLTPLPIGIREEVTIMGPARGLLPTPHNLKSLVSRLAAARGELIVFGYQRRVPSGDRGSTPTPLPGIVGFRLASFPAVDVATLRAKICPGVRLQVCGSMVFVDFSAPDPVDDAARRTLIALWKHILSSLSDGDPVSAAGSTASRAGGSNGAIGA